MKYLIAISVFVSGTLIPLAVKGQSVVLTPGSSASGSWMGSGPFRDGPWGFGQFGGPRTVVYPPFFGYPSNYPFTYFYPSLWPPLDVQYQQASLIAHGDVAAEVAAQEKELLTSQVQALTDEVHSLREQQTLRQFARELPAAPRAESLPQPMPQVSQPTFPVTVFIYRDGHEMEVRDYAVLGKTLWVFNGQTARKFPLTDFNIAASRQVNEEHGVEFPLPDPHQQ